MYYWAHSEKILQKLEILPVSKPAWPDQEETQKEPVIPKENGSGNYIITCKYLKFLKYKIIMVYFVIPLTS